MSGTGVAETSAAVVAETSAAGWAEMSGDGGGETSGARGAETSGARGVKGAEYCAGVSNGDTVGAKRARSDDSVTGKTSRVSETERFHLRAADIRKSIDFCV